MCLTGMHPKMHLRVLEEHAPKVQLTNRHVAAFMSRIVMRDMPDAKSVSGIRGLKAAV